MDRKRSNESVENNERDAKKQRGEDVKEEGTTACSSQSSSSSVCDVDSSQSAPPFPPSNPGIAMPDAEQDSQEQQEEKKDESNGMVRVLVHVHFPHPDSVGTKDKKKKNKRMRAAVGFLADRRDLEEIDMAHEYDPESIEVIEAKNIKDVINPAHLNVANVLGYLFRNFVMGNTLGGDAENQAIAVGFPEELAMTLSTYATERCQLNPEADFSPEIEFSVHIK